MIFSKVSKDKKLEILKTKMSKLEEDVFTKILSINFDPDSFNLENFKSFFYSMKEEDKEKDLSLYNSYKQLDEMLIFYIDLQNKIIVLETENNEI